MSKKDLQYQFNHIVIGTNKLVLKYRRLLNEAKNKTQDYQREIDNFWIPAHKDRTGPGPRTSVNDLIYHRDKWHARAAVYENIINDLDNLLE